MRKTIAMFNIFMWRIKILQLRLKGEKRIALTSFPRSGNTWLRSMIEAATGVQTGSIYDDRILPRSREGIVIKTHKIDSYRYTHAIHLVRNPFDAIESYYHWLLDFDENSDLVWESHVQASVKQWHKHSKHWSKCNCVVLRVRYEDFKSDAVQSLRQLLLWLGFDLPEERVQAVVKACSLQTMREKNPQGGDKFFRKGLSGEGITQFSDDQRAFVIDNLRGLLVEFGYEEFVSMQ